MDEKRTNSPGKFTRHDYSMNAEGFSPAFLLEYKSVKSITPDWKDCT